MFVYRECDGVVTPYFQYVDTLFDAILDAGVRPFVEFGFSPPELARETGTVFWWGANGSPPTDYVKWAKLVGMCVEHWIDRYGIGEVRSWYFEIWNEPNLDPFFRGTRSEYFELYRVSVEAIKRADEQLRVGGPATSNFVPDARFAGETEDRNQHAVVLEANDLDALDWKPVWLEEFLGYCQAQRVPVDFVSCHPYPTDWALDSHNQGRKLTRGVDATATDLRTIRAIVDESAFPDAEIHLTEWNSSSSPRDNTHDYTQAATFVVKANLESIGLVDSLAYWTFTDIFEENGAGQEPFHGGFGMINQHGIPKPTMHAYRMLNALGDELVLQERGFVVTRASKSGKVSSLIYHYPQDVSLTIPASFDTRDVADATLKLGRDEPLNIELTGLPPGSAWSLEVIDEDHGSAIPAWASMGGPNNLSRQEVERVTSAANAGLIEEVLVASDGVLRISRLLKPWSIALLTER
jgi:xylan 1,4-beta-xylosidase